jgi:hypothetical protein
MPWPDLRRKHETTLIGDDAKIGEIFAEFWKMNLKAPYYP